MNAGNVASSMSHVRRNRLRVWVGGLLLCGLVIAAYQPAWNAGFIWDDDLYVTENALLTAPDGLKRIWFSRDSPSQYFPLVYTTFRMERAFWDLNPAGYHWVNILLHAVNALLLWRLLRRLNLPGAWLAAVLFALHPVHVESVAWITERKNVLMLFFSLLTLRCWVEFIERENSPWRFYALAIACYLLALFSKTTACTIPAALLLVLWLKKMPVHRARLFQIIPFLVLGVGMGLVTMWWERYHIGTRGEIFGLDPLERILIASRAAWFYLGKLIWPADLAFSYPRWDINAAHPGAYVWLLAGAALALAIYRGRRTFGRGVEVAALFFVATLSPVLGIIMLYTFRYTFVADHYQYFASIGPIALFAAAIVKGAEHVSRHPRVLQMFVVGVLIVSLGALTWRQSGHYKDLETLWNATLKTNPNSLLARNNLGNIYLDRGETEAAMAQFQKALALDPNNPESRNNIGLALMRHGKSEEAIAAFQASLQLQPRFAETHYNLANALLESGRLEAAIAHYRQATEHRPRFAAAHNDLGHALLAVGRLDEAIRCFETAVQVQPSFAQAIYNLGNALSAKGEHAEAVRCYRRALACNPRLAEAHNNLGLCLLQNHLTEEAALHFRKAVEIQPRNALAHGNLANALLKLGRADEAIQHYQRALEIRPDYLEIYYRQANALLQMRRTREAIACYKKIVELQPTNAEAHQNLGAVLCLAGEAREGLAEFETVLKLNPNHVMALKNMAWVLATYPDGAVRNGPKAVELARRANELSGGQNPAVLSTLAAAYAEAGQFSEALATARRAFQLATDQPHSALAIGISEQLKHYEANRPFRDDREMLR